MTKSSISVFIVIVAIALLSSGCIQVNSGNKAVNANGGVYKSVDKGTTWQQKAVIPTASGKPANFVATDAASIAMDPNDSQAVYFGSIGSGLLYSYDGGNTWQLAKGIGSQTVRAVAVAPGDKCVIYAAVGNKVLKSDDCNRSWKQVYFDNDTVATVNTIAVDHADPALVYVGVSRGDLIKSLDKGESWQTVQRLKNAITKIVLDPADSRNLYILTAKKGVYRSADGGASATDINDVLKENKFNLEVKDIGFVPAEPGTVYLAASYGLLVSKDNGVSWDKIELLSPENKAVINALAVNPKNGQEIYYTTNTTFYRTIDGGASWTPVKLPTARAGARLVIDPETGAVFLGVRTLAK